MRFEAATPELLRQFQDEVETVVEAAKSNAETMQQGREFRAGLPG